MGRQVVQDIVVHMTDGDVVEKMPKISQIPKGMILVVGNEELVSLLDGVAVVNKESYLEEYADYCLGKVLAMLGA